MRVEDNSAKGEQTTTEYQAQKKLYKGRKEGTTLQAINC